MEEKSFDGRGVLKTFVKCLIIEMIISILGMLILALVLSKTSVSDNIMGNVIIGISAFAISIGGFIGSRNLKIKGIFSGALQGIFYMLALYLISSIASQNFSVGIQGLVMIIVGIVAGAVGGIIGANIK